jgi:hypothetical protein
MQQSTPSGKKHGAFRIGLVLVFLGSLIWLFLGWPLPFRLAVVLIVAAGSAAAVFAAFYIPNHLDERLKRGLAAGAGIITLVATVFAVPGLVQGAANPQSTGSQSPSPADVLFDDFNSENLDPNKWTMAPLNTADPLTLRDQIFVKDGKLHLKVSADYFRSDRVDAELRANVPSDWIISKISIKMTLESQVGSNDGTAYLSISSVQDRESRIGMGRNRESEPTLDYVFCDQMDANCHYLEQHKVERRHEYQIEAVASRKNPDSNQMGLDFNVAEHKDWSKYATPDSGNIRSFRFYLYSDPEADLDVTVDDVRITYSK